MDTNQPPQPPQPVSTQPIQATSLNGAFKTSSPSSKEDTVLKLLMLSSALLLLVVIGGGVYLFMMNQAPKVGAVNIKNTSVKPKQNIIEDPTSAPTVVPSLAPTTTADLPSDQDVEAIQVSSVEGQMQDINTDLNGL
jgi:hypothetical protein